MQNTKNGLIDLLSDKKVWLNWTFEPKKGSDGKQSVRQDGTMEMTKVPRTLTGSYGSSTNPDTWSTFEEAQKAVGKEISYKNIATGAPLTITGIGIAFETSLNILGVDFDHCLEDGKITHEGITNFLQASETYTEVSPSGTGLHAYFQVETPFDPLLNKRPVKGYDEYPLVEFYSKGRYFTFTGNIFDTNKPVRKISEEELVKLLALLGYPWGKGVESSIQPVAPQNYTSPFSSDPALMEKMFASRNGAKLSRLFNGDMSDCKNDHSAADLSFCSALAFWTGKDTVRMDEIFRSSGLMREKWDEQRGLLTYGQMTINKAVEGCMEVYKAPSERLQKVSFQSPNKDENTEIEFIMSAGTEEKPPFPLPILENICRVIEFDPVLKTQFRLNDFSHMVEMFDETTSSWINLQDFKVIDTQRFISVKYTPFTKVGYEMVTRAICSVAHKFKVNPPKDYLTKLEWDGKPRLNSWLHMVYGTPDDALHQAMGSNWLKGLVKRIMRPGCLFDEVLVLESGQGWRKSSSLRELGKPWHVENTLSIEDRDFPLVVASNIIVEFSDGAGANRADSRKLKAIITKVEDQCRPPYERGVITFKRGCVFAMTTNDSEWIKDETGGRRWLPVKLEKHADVDWIKENRDQLFAEAYHRVIENGETTHEYPQEELQKLQASRMETDDHEEDLVKWYIGLTDDVRAKGIRVDDAYQQISGVSEYREMKKIDQLRTAGMLKSALGLEKKQLRIGGIVSKRWFATEETAKKFGIQVANDGTIQTPNIKNVIDEKTDEIPF